MQAPPFLEVLLQGKANRTGARMGDILGIAVTMAVMVVSLVGLVVLVRWMMGLQEATEEAWKGVARKHGLTEDLDVPDSPLMPSQQAFHGEVDGLQVKTKMVYDAGSITKFAIEGRTSWSVQSERCAGLRIRSRSMLVRGARTTGDSSFDARFVVEAGGDQTMSLLTLPVRQALLDLASISSRVEVTDKEVVFHYRKLRTSQAIAEDLLGAAVRVAKALDTASADLVAPRQHRSQQQLADRLRAELAGDDEEQTPEEVPIQAEVVSRHNS